MRRGLGNGSGGGVKRGWKPPTLTTTFASSPHATRTPISPSIVMKRMRDSNSEAKKYARLRSHSSAPAKLTCRTTTASSSSVGSARRSTPRIAMLPGGIWMITPSDSVTIEPPQPSFAIGPTRNVPSCAGKIVRRSLRIRGALATTSRGNMIPSIAPVLTPSMSACSRIVRLRPSRPPTPLSTNP